MAVLRRVKTLAVIVMTLLGAHWLTPAFQCKSPVAAISGSKEERRNIGAAGVAGDAAKRRAANALDELPLHFEENQGRAANGSRFIARAAGLDFSITPTEAVMHLRAGEQSAAPFRYATPTRIAGVRELEAAPASPTRRRTASLRMQLVGANRRARLTGENQLTSRTNYFIGNDETQWSRNVPDYARVRVEQIYRGVDVVYYGSSQQLEYDFNVAPGAGYKAIRLRFSGATRMAIDESGDLVIETPAGEIRHRKPVVYQHSGNSRDVIPARYVIHTNRRVGFEVAPYEKNKQLIIDPVVSYSTYLGGTGEDAINAIVIDSSGNAYVTGMTRSMNLPTTPGAFQATRARSGIYAFVTKFNLASNTLAYSTYLGGTGNQAVPPESVGAGIALDSRGNVYVTGATTATDFPTTPGAFQAARGGTTNSPVLTAFVTKLNPDGSALTYSTYLGGSRIVNTFAPDLPATRAAAIAVDGFDNAYVTGSTNTLDFPTTASALQPNKDNASCSFGLDRDYPCSEGFVTKLNQSGTALVYSTYLGGHGDDFCNGIAIDSSGNAYVVGTTVSFTFPTARPLQPSSGGGSDAFVSKLNAEGEALIYSTYLGGGGNDFGNGIAVDSTGNAYVTGTAYSTDLPVTPGAFQPASSGVTLFKTTDGGMLWKASNKRLPSDFGVQLLAVDRLNPSTIYAGISARTSGGVFKSVDGGSSWSGAIVKDDFFPAEIVVVAFDPQKPSTSYAAFNRVNPFSSELRKSQDGGLTWSPVTPPPFQFGFGSLSVAELAIDPADSAILYFGTRFKSSDGGLRWKQIGKGLPGSGLVLAIDPTNSSILYARILGVGGGTTGLFRSTSGGKKWGATDLSNVSIRAVAFDALNPSRLYAGGDGIFKSDDGGATWKAVKSKTTLPMILQLVVDPVDPSNIYAITIAGFFKSTNHGKNWIAANAGLSNDVLYAAIDPKNPSTLYAGSGPRGADAFVAKLNAAGSAFAYLTYLGGSNHDRPTSIAVDRTGSAYVTGATESNDFPTKNAVQPAKGPEHTGHPFLTKLNLAGADVDFSTYLGGSNVEEARGVAVDSAGSAYVVGLTQSPDLATTADAFQKIYGGAGDGFLMKLDSTGVSSPYPPQSSGKHTERSLRPGFSGNNRRRRP